MRYAPPGGPTARYRRQQSKRQVSCSSPSPGVLRGPSFFVELLPFNHAHDVRGTYLREAPHLFPGPSKTGSFCRSVQGRIHRDPENKCAPLPYPGGRLILARQRRADFRRPSFAEQATPKLGQSRSMSRPASGSLCLLSGMCETGKFHP